MNKITLRSEEESLFKLGFDRPTLVEMHGYALPEEEMVIKNRRIPVPERDFDA